MSLPDAIFAPILRTIKEFSKPNASSPTELTQIISRGEYGDWGTTDVSMTDYKTGQVIFCQKEVRHPAHWSRMAVEMVVSKYFFGKLGTPDRETSVHQVLHRISFAYSEKLFSHYRATRQEADAFYCALYVLQYHQVFAFNSPVWFNQGLSAVYNVRSSEKAGYRYNPVSGQSELVDAVEWPQLSACFILGLKDSISSIWQVAGQCAHLFKYGSGAGVSLSPLRGDSELLSGGGKASGPVSFGDVIDTTGKVIKSGGRCLSAGTRVYTTQGPKAVESLVGTEFEVLSYDPPSNRYTVKRAQAWASGEKQLVKVTTDKGSFITSYDHPFRLSTGQSCRASELKVGQSLFNCVIDLTSDGYLRVGLKDGMKGRERLHRMVAQDICNRNTQGMSVHHVDGNIFNNHSSNLEVIPQSEHATQHGKELAARGEHVFQLRDFRRCGQDNPMASGSPFWRDEEKSKAYREKQRAKLAADPGRAVKQAHMAVTQRYMNVGYRIINAGYSIDTLEQFFSAYVKVFGRIDSKQRRIEAINKRFGSYENYRKELSLNNHRVVAVETLSVGAVYSVEVFCPTEDDKSPSSGHNYVIWPSDSMTGSGVCVFNTRRAAIMLTLDDHHPDVLDFARVKHREEQKAKALIKEGYPADYNGEAYRTVGYQNTNISVRLSDEFMRAVAGGDRNDKIWSTTRVSDGQPGKSFPARELIDAIAESVWSCGDPGVQFSSMINEYHTVPNEGSINSSNPCSEFVHLDDTSCNLASSRLTAFLDSHGRFRNQAFIDVCKVIALAQDVGIEMSSFPSASIAERTYKSRPIGLGYADLGSLFMRLGLSYGSQESLHLCSSITSLMTASVYAMSANLARHMTPFEYWGSNSIHMSRVIGLHKKSSNQLARDTAEADLAKSNDVTQMISNIAQYAQSEWYETSGPFRNSQATVLAPTGTIAFAMDCDTTGIEPVTGLKVFKKLAGGGTIQLVNNGVAAALQVLGYTDSQIRNIVDYVQKFGFIEGAPGVAVTHYPVFDTAFSTPANGDNPGSSRSIHWRLHLAMLEAAQPYLSGAISKTINMPPESTVDDIRAAIVIAWKANLKAVAIYRDGSKWSQPLSTTDNNTKGAEKGTTKLSDVKEPDDVPVSQPFVVPAPVLTERAVREKLPSTRSAVIHKFTIAGHDCYLSVGLYPDGRPAEVFIKMNREGSTIAGLMDTVGILISMLLQYGVDLRVITNKLSYMDFEPRGLTLGCDDIKTARSVVDYIARWMELNFSKERSGNGSTGSLKQEGGNIVTGIPCHVCGGLTVRTGPCLLCKVCGSTSGGCG